jgi:diadenosine tetraphosphatase ApaH/serine/threonine PP2A family protein phosphatase
VFDLALGGRAKERPELVDVPLPLHGEIPVLACRGGVDLLRRLALTGTLPLHALLSHLYVLIPVLDNDKHYWVGDDEVEKLLRHGEGWLSAHPERPLIATRYLKYRRNLVDDALAQLEEIGSADARADRNADEEAALERSVAVASEAEEPSERPPSLHDVRLGTVHATLVVAHAGLKAEMQGRGSGSVRDFCLYGETTGETDDFGLPVRYNWAADYRGAATVVYGHTTVPDPERLNRTININTGCVFGGRPTALRFPEMASSEPSNTKCFRAVVSTTPPTTGSRSSNTSRVTTTLTANTRLSDTKPRSNSKPTSTHQTSKLTGP